MINISSLICGVGIYEGADCVTWCRRFSYLETTYWLCILKS